MAQTGFTPIIPYSSTTSTNVPLAADMQTNEIAINSSDRVIYTKDGTGLVVAIGSGATGGGDGGGGREARDAGVVGLQPSGDGGGGADRLSDDEGAV